MTRNRAKLERGHMLHCRCRSVDEGGDGGITGHASARPLAHPRRARILQLRTAHVRVEVPIQGENKEKWGRKEG